MDLVLQEVVKKLSSKKNKAIRKEINKMLEGQDVPDFAKKRAYKKAKKLYKTQEK